MQILRPENPHLSPFLVNNTIINLKTTSVELVVRTFKMKYYVNNQEFKMHKRKCMVA